MKKIAIDSSLVVLAIATVATVTLLANVYLVRPAEAPDAAACTRRGTNHLVVISNDVLNTPNTTAKLCDTLTILNKDERIRLIAFGPHDSHIPYDGITEQALAESQSFTIVLNKLGTYSFHDHTEAALAGTFTVNKS